MNWNSRTVGSTLIAGAMLLALATVVHAQEVVVGVPVSTTGIFSFAGVPGRDGALAALEDINASGELGKVKLKLLIEDTASDKNQATTVISRFAANKDVVLILGPTSSVESFAALPVAQQNKIPAIPIALGNVQTVGDYIFKSTASPVDLMDGFARNIVERFKPQKIAYVFNRDNDAYISQKNAAKSIFEAKGARTVTEETIVGSDTDFSALATKLASLDIDTILITTTAEVSANVIIQAKQAGLSPRVRILGSSALASQQFVKVGGEAVEGAIFVSDYFPRSDNPLNRTFVTTYKRLFKVEPDLFAATGYNQLRVAAAAIKAAGPKYDRQSIRDALATKIKNIPAVTRNGVISITDERIPAYDSYVLTVRNGKFEQL
jgi:branched-chain amino acid transport system substrate-binding protein